MSTPTLRRGSRGASVTTMQRRLTAHGIPTTADGVFGAKTETNVRTFQRARRLKVDGVVGAKTWAALNSQSAREIRDETAAILSAMGWRVNTDARYVQSVKDFQRMWNLGPALKVDGIVGRATLAALRKSKNAGGKISANFEAREFACKCGGRYADCRRIWAHRSLVQGAERYRSLVGPFTPVSACRCASHNAAVGGYHRSQHIHGTAMDVVATQHVTRVTALRTFPAIGINRGSRSVRHLDFRNLSSDNFPRATGSVTSPYVYYYG
jgi:hypothetical protein